ncbi:MAG: hypothetical protein Q7T74_04900, partial [Candidatus Saccharibacteria bacterium]|nr:hypothetical protein [Candidatus Saccharibacteria bacterium]
MKIQKSKLLVLRIFLALLGVMIVSSGAVASVKWSQLPDTTVNGIDIRCDRNDGIKRTLADDFKCTTTGPISDVHFWGSWKGDIKTQVTQIHLSIHEDIPANGTTPSMPGALLWSGDFVQGQFTEKLVYNLGNYFEWWWDPYIQGTLTPNGDHKIWRYDIKINNSPTNPWFVQQGNAANPKIYWLDVYVITADGAAGPTQFGWKTSRKNWQDKAGYVAIDGSWQDMTYPATHPYAGKPIDMAFEITTTTTATPHPYVAIDGFAVWEAAVLDGTVSPVDEANGLAYMEKWHNQGYPETIYNEPELYAYAGNPCSGSDSDPCSPGLVMAWGNPNLPDGSYSAAWKYKYPVDPDLTNSIITVTVFPPCKSINAVSLGLKDIYGNIRAWFWDVNLPGGIPCGVGTAISIDTSIPGILAATPAAAGYMSDPGFDITKVVEITFDENAIWVAGTTVPPPGSTILRAW